MRTDRIIGLVATGLAVALAGCGDAGETGFLSINQVSRYALEENGCGAPDKTLLPSLAYDAGLGAELGKGYSLGVWVQNGLVTNEDSGLTSIGRTNTNRIQVDRMVVDFPDRERWGFLPESIEVGMPFVLESGAELGWPSMLLPPAVAAELVENPASPIRADGASATMPIHLRASGKLLDGSDVDSNEFSLVLSVCNHCMPGHCPIGQEFDTGCSYAQPDLYECKDVETAP